MGLTIKQTLFVENYVIDLNATKAAIAAGYSRKTAHVIGCQNLNKLNIKVAVQAAMEAKMERLKISQNAVFSTGQIFPIK